MIKSIKNVVVLGSGIMGSRIACHFANIGVKVLLLDIAPKELTDAEKAKNLNLDDPRVKNRIVNDALQAALKSNPSPIYKKEFALRIKTGNFSDNMKDIAEYDWILEAVVENLDIKKSIFEQVEKYRKKGTIVSSNTSGIPISLMMEGRSEDFKKNFLGTHFFNPPRYLKLLEIIPTEYTDKELTDFMMHYGDLYLGKTTVLCKDTPAFIANRIGIYSMLQVMKTMQELDLTIDETDKLTGPVIGRPKSATFRTSDVVGLDTLLKVADNLYKGLKNDDAKDIFNISAEIKQMAENKWLGDKTGQGFYKKTKGEGGKTEILTLDLKTMEYGPQKKVKFATLEQTKAIDSLKDRFKVLISGKDKAAEFYRKSFAGVFNYVSYRIPEVADEIYKIDDALKAGFGWELGPFETWDAIGLENGIKLIEENGQKPATWVYEMHKAGHTSFYKNENGKRVFYGIPARSYQEIPGTNQFILLDTLREKNVIWKNSGASLFDIGDGILNLEFHTKMNTLGGEVVEGINRAIAIAEKDYRGLVIGNEASNFSAGANLALIFMYAIEQEYDEIDFMIRQFQNTMMRIRYSSIPVISAPAGLALGGGCELTMHADHVQAHAETYIGLVEFGVGLIPGGGGTKEMALRVSDSFETDDIMTNNLKNAYLNIAMAKVATSAYEAKEMNILRASDGITLNRSRLIADAKRKALELAKDGYTMPVQRTDIKVLGKSALGMFIAGANSMKAGHYISEHDQKISEKLAYVMCGGDLSQPSLVSEQYLLDLEREAFLSLTGEKKTLERIQSILNSGKPLRN
jgi:3-hydroxyacyl-CoA dehydrogenase